MILNNYKAMLGLSSENDPTLLKFVFDTPGSIDFKSMLNTSSNVDINFGNGQSYKGAGNLIPVINYTAGTYTANIMADEISLIYDHPNAQVLTELHFGSSAFKEVHVFNSSSLAKVTIKNPPNFYSIENISGFIGAKNLISLPHGLMDKFTNNKGSFQCFAGCLKITEIPTG